VPRNFNLLQEIRNIQSPEKNRQDRLKRIMRRL
jgi:hypothetical protein